MSVELKDHRHTKSFFPWCHELLSYHILCIGGLETPGCVKAMKKYLAQFGKIVWVRIFPNVQAPGGFAHIILDRPESYHKLFARSTHSFEGANLRIKMWRRPSDGDSYDSKINERKVFIKNMASFITEKHLFEYFSGFGQIDAIEIPALSLSEATRKIGYITFQTKLAAELVLETPNHIIRKNKVKCRKYCTDKKDSDWHASITIPNQPPVNSDGVQPRGIAALPNINLYKVFKRGKKKFMNMQTSSEGYESSPDSFSEASLRDLKPASPLSTSNSIKTLLPNKPNPSDASLLLKTPNNPYHDDSQPQSQAQPDSPRCSGLSYLRRPLFVHYYTVIGKY